LFACTTKSWNTKEIQKGVNSLVSFVVCAKILPLGGQKRNFVVAHTKDFSENKCAKVARFWGNKFWNQGA
jgi:hypothetical protein